ncbi:hypothetical protein FB451DRAFT_525803 [Mycena latifolia]|nr:hypothetical protein FB451DRAFT_525803 [Mycena latifolia]
MDAHVPTRKKHKITPAREKRLTSFDGKTCSLAWVLLMPLDIIFEVFGYLNPSDLLGLARMTKSLRRVLMHKSSMSVWKTARSNVPWLPDAPPGMSEPAWANLVFDRHCHYCLAKGVRKIHWRLRVRLCKPCSEKHFVSPKLLHCCSHLMSFQYR